MKLKFILLIFVALVALTGCSNNSPTNHPDESEEGGDGLGTVGWYVIKKENQKALVVNPIPKDYSATGGIEEFYDAVWVSNFPDDAQVGQKVKILFEGEMATSYPGLGGAKKVSILPSIKPENAKMTEAQVLRSAISSKEAADIIVFVPTAIVFDDKAHLWTVHFKDGTSVTEAHVVEISD